jgi:hypothetical protein
MTIEDILKKIHRKFAKDTDYPEAGSEDLLVRLDHVDDAISEWENCVFEGYNWKELMVAPTAFVFGGTGTDSLPADFLSFPRYFSQKTGFTKAQLEIGSTIYTEVKAGEGAQMEQEGLSPYVFWIEGGNIRTLPAVSGTINLPYLKKATRYTTGAETDEPEMEIPKFIEDYAVAKIFLDNDDEDLYQSFMNSAAEKLKQMKYNALS